MILVYQSNHFFDNFCYNIDMSKFIVIDGTDGSGKATQTAKLEERLRADGYDVLVMDFPQYGQKSAALVEEYLNGAFGSADEVDAYQASVFYAVDRFAAKKEMYAHLEQGGVVLSNRYVSSNQIHQSGKIQDKAELDVFLDWLDDFEFNIMGIPQPDNVFFLNVPTVLSDELKEKKDARAYIEGGKTKDIHESDAGHIQSAYTRARELVDRYLKWERVDCLDDDGNLRAVDDIAEQLYVEVSAMLGTK